MKKFLILMGLLIPMFTFAENTCEVINDTSTKDTRNLTCDSKLQTVTKYKIDNINPLENDNEVCKITCTEEVIFAFDPIKKVLAGMGFTYPLRVSGTRKCSATYEFKTYEEKIRRLVNNYENATGDAKETAKNEIVNYYAKKKACDEFNKGNEAETNAEKKDQYKNEYKYTGNVAAKIQYTESNVQSEEIIKYQFIEEEKSLIYNLDEVFEDSCRLNENDYSCIEEEKSLRGWTSTSTIIGKYTMPYSYVEKYTGEVSSSPNPNTCNAKDRFFTDTSALTKPVSNNLTDRGYEIVIGHLDSMGKFSNYAVDLGNNLEDNKKWELGITCYYQVKNYVFPQKDDENYDNFGSTGFMYRIIDVNNPFPDRIPNANWVGKESIIFNTKDKLSSLKKFIINLDRASIDNIKDYNKDNYYDTFNLDEMEKSNFIINNVGIITRN